MEWNHAVRRPLFPRLATHFEKGTMAPGITNATPNHAGNGSSPECLKGDRRKYSMETNKYSFQPLSS